MPTAPSASPSAARPARPWPRAWTCRPARTRSCAASSKRRTPAPSPRRVGTDDGAFAGGSGRDRGRRPGARPGPRPVAGPRGRHRRGVASHAPGRRGHHPRSRRRLRLGSGGHAERGGRPVPGVRRAGPGAGHAVDRVALSPAGLLAVRGWRGTAASRSSGRPRRRSFNDGRTTQQRRRDRAQPRRLAAGRGPPGQGSSPLPARPRAAQRFDDVATSGGPGRAGKLYPGRHETGPPRQESARGTTPGPQPVAGPICHDGTGLVKVGAEGKRESRLASALMSVDVQGR